MPDAMDISVEDMAQQKSGTLVSDYEQLMVKTWLFVRNQFCIITLTEADGKSSNSPLQHQLRQINCSYGYCSEVIRSVMKLKTS